MGWLWAGLLLAGVLSLVAGRVQRPGLPAASLVESQPPRPYQEDTVVRVLDGDTAVGRRFGRIRYIGIDAPELGATRPATRAAALRALEANRQLVEGRQVQLVQDLEPRDEYGRMLAYVWAEGRFVNAYLVAQGVARAIAIPPNTRYARALLQLERQARAAGVGLWAGPSASEASP